ncbi:MAG: glycine--tRNA ligase subunit beta, partial [Gammaproteobacteria bacterium]
QIQARKGDVAPLFEAGDYIKGMELLAGLKPAVDKFFDEVLVMAEDEKIRSNRLALLHGLRALFLSVADISELHVA